jgi:hypothetical protein
MASDLPLTEYILLGYDLTGLVPCENGVTVEQWRDGFGLVGVAGFPGGITNGRVTLKYTCLQGLAQTLAYPFDTFLPPPYSGCCLRKTLFEDTGPAETTVSLIYESESFLIQVGPGQTVIELESGLFQIPTEQAPRFALNLTPDQLLDVARALLRLNDGVSTFSSSASDPITVTTPGQPTITLSGADDPTNSVGTQRELFLQIAVHKVDTLTMSSSILVKTTGYADQSWAASVAENNTLVYPGLGLPGTQLNWKVSETRVTQRGSATEASTRIEQNPFGWDPRYYALGS